jgi:hypothetical protein
MLGYYYGQVQNTTTHETIYLRLHQKTDSVQQLIYIC